MRGPFTLAPSQVNLRIPRSSRGVFCLGKAPNRVTYVGRAEQDLNTEIRSHGDEYRFFWYEMVITPRELYLTQCRVFHKYADLGELASTEHPVPPARVEDPCPVCGRLPSEVAGGAFPAQQVSQPA